MARRQTEEKPKWQTRLAKEREYTSSFEGMTEAEWRVLMHGQKLLSNNHDTIVALDWPHYCTDSTVACGGQMGYCYTFQGNQAKPNHDRHVAMVDVLARSYPQLFGELVFEEIAVLVAKDILPYPNLRYSGSGEMTRAHLPALRAVHDRGVRLWGFTRSLVIAVRLREWGVGVLLSCDRTTNAIVVERALSLGIGLAYVSADVSDVPPRGTVVTFPIHRGGRVREVVEADTLCPKILDDFFFDMRPGGSCQSRCTRCHLLPANRGIESESR